MKYVLAVLAVLAVSNNRTNLARSLPDHLTLSAAISAALRMSSQPNCFFVVYLQEHFSTSCGMLHTYCDFLRYNYFNVGQGRTQGGNRAMAPPRRSNCYVTLLVAWLVWLVPTGCPPPPPRRPAGFALDVG